MQCKLQIDDIPDGSLCSIINRLALKSSIRPIINRLALKSSTTVVFAGKRDNTSCSISDTGYRQCANEFADFACISRQMIECTKYTRYPYHISIEELQYIDASDTKW